MQLNIFPKTFASFIMFCKLLIPMFEDLISFIATLNYEKKGNPLDADLKCKLNRYLVQLKKATEGKQFTN